MLLDYFKTYRELLDVCRKKEILLVGVSKESKSVFYRDYLLRLVLDETLGAADIDAADVEALKTLFSELSIHKEDALNALSNFQRKYGAKLEAVGLIFDELASSRPDYQLIMNLAKTPGYTKPLLVGPSAKMAQRLGQIEKGPAGYVRSQFPTTTRKEGKDFVVWASGIIRGLATFPSFVSLHLLLDTRDSPIRIDVPCWDRVFVQTPTAAPVDFNVDRILTIMVTGYGGLDCHNLWLKNVDEKVKLKNRMVDTVYFPLMEKLFNEKIIRGRSYRRVKFP